MVESRISRYCWLIFFLFRIDYCKLQAIGDNSTVNTIAIQSTIDTCHETCFLESAPSRILHDGVRPVLNGKQEPPLQEPQPQPQRVVVYVPKGMFRTGSLKLRSNTRFHIGKGASIYGSDNPKDYPVVAMVPNGYETHKRAMFRALFSGFNVENVSITGENYGYPPGSFARFSPSPAGSATMNGSWNDTTMSVIDGVGWKWWCKFRYATALFVYLFACLLRLHRTVLFDNCSTMLTFFRRFTSRYYY